MPREDCSAPLDDAVVLRDARLQLSALQRQRIPFEAQQVGIHLWTQIALMHFPGSTDLI